MGALGARAPPRAEKKILGPNLQGKFVRAPQAESAPPRQSKSPIFEKIGGGRGYLRQF